MNRVKRIAALAIMAAVLALAVLAWSIRLSSANTLPASPDPSAEGGGGSTGDSLHFGESDADTIGPAYIGACQKVHLVAQWNGDSANVAVSTSINGVKWYPLTSLAAALAGYDSLGIYYNKVYSTAVDTSAAITTGTCGPWIRMFITNGAVLDSTISSITQVWGVIECAQ